MGAVTEISPARLRYIAFRTMPLLCSLYFFELFGRSSISAVHDEMLHDLHMTELDYSNAVSAFFVAYIIFQVPSNIVLSHWSASKMFGILTICIGILGSLLAFANTGIHVTLLRLGMGVAQAGVYPGLIYYISLWFPADHVPTKIAIIGSGAGLTAITGGIITYGALHISSFLGIKGWQWTFIIEGVPAILCGILVLIYLPDNPQNAEFLTPDEKKYYEQLHAKKEKITCTRVLEDLSVIKDLRLLTFGTATFLGASSLYAYVYYAPTIMSMLVSSDETGNLLTSPFSLVSSVTGILFAKMAERDGRYYAFSIGGGAAAVVSLVLLGLSLVHSSRVYIILALSLWSIVGMCWFNVAISWMAVTYAGKASSIALSNAMGNIGGILGPTIMASVSTRLNNYGYGLMACSLLQVLCILLMIILAATRSRKRTSESTEEAGGAGVERRPKTVDFSVNDGGATEATRLLK